MSHHGGTCLYRGPNRCGLCQHQPMHWIKQHQIQYCCWPMPVRCGWCCRDDLNLDPPKQTSVKYISTEWMILRAHPMPPFFWKRPWSYDPQPIWSLSSNKVACQQSDEFRSLVSKHQRGCRFDKFAVPQYRPQNWHRPCQIDPNRGFEDSFPLKIGDFQGRTVNLVDVLQPKSSLTRADSGWLGDSLRCP